MSFSDESDLSEPPSDIEETPPQPPVPEPPVARTSNGTRTTTQQATVRSQKRANPTLAPRLRQPRSPSQAVTFIYGQLSRGYINVDPEYQRGVVWTEQKQMGLIDSLMHNYYIPPIIFSFITGEGDQPDLRTCIDGKQRLTSIQQFMDGEIPWKDSQTSRKLWYKNKSGKRGKLMSEAQRDRFHSAQIVCIEYETLDVCEEREIFQRVQLGVALTPAERLKAINGSYANLVREMDKALAPNLKNILHWENAKGRDFLALARLVYIIDGTASRAKGDTRLTEPLTATIEKYLQDKHDLKKDVPVTLSTAALGVTETLNCIFKDIREEKDTMTQTFGGMYPVEFLVACYLVHLYRAKFSVARLSDAIRRMRRAALNVGTRPTPKVHKELMEFVCKTIPTLGGNNGGEPLASLAKYVADPEDMEVPVASTSVSSNRAGTFAPKRKRDQEDEDGDADSEADSKPKPKLKRKPGRPSKRQIIHDEESDDDHDTIVTVAPPQPKTPAPKESLSKRLANANSASGSRTTVKRTAAKTKASTSAPVKSTIAKTKPAAKDAQIGTPSEPPAPANRIRKTANPVASTSTTHIERAGSHRFATATPSPSIPYMTPPISATSIIPPRKNIPLPGRSRPHTPMTVEPSNAPAPNDIKADSRNSRSTSSSAPPRQLSNQPDRLAPIREAKGRIAAQLQQNTEHVSASQLQTTHDPRRRTVQTSTTINVVEDAEAQFHSKLDELPKLLSPEVSPLPPSKLPQVVARSNAVASSSASQPSGSRVVTMGDETNVLNGTLPIRRDPASVPSTQGRIPFHFKKNGGAPLNLDTNIDRFSHGATSAHSGISPALGSSTSASFSSNGANRGPPPSSVMSPTAPLARPPPTAPAAYHSLPSTASAGPYSRSNEYSYYDQRDRRHDRWSQLHCRTPSMGRRPPPSRDERSWDPEAPDRVRGPRGGVSRGAS